MLNNRADSQTLLYILITTALPAYQWQLDQVYPLLMLLSFVMAFAVGAMHHNHAHIAMWKHPFANALTDYWFTLMQGHPGFLFCPAHLENHHRYLNGEKDFNRTYRRHDDNNLLGFLLHPLESMLILLPVMVAFLRTLLKERRKQLYIILSHYFLLIAFDVLALAWDWRKALLFIVAPQLAALFFLLASNYLQHAHTDERSEWNHSRNFVGWINPLFFNVGYHAAHHHNSDLHWSRLPAAHKLIEEKIDKRLIEKSFIWYCLRVYVLSFFIAHLQSSPLRQTRSHHE